MKTPIAILFCAVSAFSQASILIPDTSLPAAQITSCSGTSPTVCNYRGLFVQSAPVFSNGDQVNVWGILENPSGTVYQYSTINSPLATLRKICGLTSSTVQFCDLTNTPVNAANPVLDYSGWFSRATVGTVTAGPLGLLDGTNGFWTQALSCTIMDSCLTNIVVTGGSPHNLATVTYAANHGFSSGALVQVRNASDANLNHGVTGGTAITSGSTSGTTVVIGVAASYGFFVGNTVTLSSGITPSGFDGLTGTVTGTTPTSVTFTVGSSPGTLTWSSGGTITDNSTANGNIITVTGPTTFTFPTDAAAATYTDTNLGVSYLAVDGSENWERAKVGIGFYFTGTAATITSGSTVGTTVTIGTSNTSGFIVGSTAHVSNGITPSGFNNLVGVVTAVVPNTSITFTATTNPGNITWVSGGNVIPYTSTPSPWLQGPGLPGGDFISAATYWYVDRSQQQALNYAITADANIEDIYPTPEWCNPNNLFCLTQGQYLDYSRASIPTVLYAHSLIYSQLSSTQRTSTANFFLTNNFELGGSCTHHDVLAYEPGTINVTGTAVVGTGTTFTIHSPGDYMQYTGVNYVRIASITDNTHLTLTSAPANATGASWFATPPNNKSTDCGYSWLAASHGANSSIDPRITLPGALGPGWPGQPGSGLSDPEMVGFSGNNQILTASAEVATIGGTFCRDDARACLLLQRENAMSWATHAVDYLGWGGFNKSGDYYGEGRTATLMAQLLTTLSHSTSFTGYANLLSNSVGFNRWLMQRIFLTVPSSQPNHSDNDGYQGWTYEWFRYFNDQGPVPTDLTIMNAAELASDKTGANYMQYYWTQLFTHQWLNAFGTRQIGLTTLMRYDPNWAATDFRTHHTNLVLNKTSNSLCTTLGLTCAGISYISGMSRGEWGWTQYPSAQSSGTSFIDEVFGQDTDHGNQVIGSMQLYKGYGINGLLVMDADGNPVLYGTTSGLFLGNVLPSATGAFDVNKPETGATLGWYSGSITDPLWSDSDDYYAATWDLTSMYGPGGPTLTRNIQQRVYFKKSATDEFIFTYRDIAGGADTKEWDDNTIGWGPYSAYTGGKLVITNGDGFRYIEKVLAPAGSTTLATISDGTGYPNSAAGGWRVRTCTSTDGSTCTTTPSTLEDLKVGYIGPSTTNDFTLTAIAPDSNWTGAIATGPTDSKIGLFARGGVTHSAITSFTTTCSTSAQYLFSGLAPGSYGITVGGTPVTGSPFRVLDGDNTVKFSAPCGALVSSFSPPTPTVVSGTVKVTGNTVIR